MLSSNMGKQMLRNAHLYQIYTYVKNEDRAHSGNVSGMLLYARTTEDIEPWMSVSIGGNQIYVKSLDLNRPFIEIAGSLDKIAYEVFGSGLQRVA